MPEVQAGASLCTAPSALPIPLPASAPMHQGVLLGFDYGTRRIGVAIGNTVSGHARPLATLAAVPNAARWQAIAALVAEWQPAALVVGVARHPDGAPHAMTAHCERFARQLEGRYRLPVERVDERYSSVEARARGATDDQLDAAAAAVLLQEVLDRA